MKTASITEAKNNLSKLIDGLRSGPVLILDRGRPVARLEAASLSAAARQDECIAGLERMGILTAPQKPWPPEFFKRPLPPAPGGASVLDALLRDREEGR